MTEIIGPIKETGADVVPSPSQQVWDFIRASKAESTIRGYRSDWRGFCGWCETHSLCPLPALPETVASFIAECAERLKVGSIQRRLNAIAEAHKAVALDSPTHHPMVTNTMKGIRRTKGTAPEQKTPTLTDDIRAMVDATDTGIIGIRDRAMVLLGFAGAFRRSELVGLDVGDCTFGKDGLTVTLRRSKTDQDGCGPEDRNPLWLQSRDVPGSHGSSVAGNGVRQHRAAVSFDQSAWSGAVRPFVRHRRFPRGEEAGGDVPALIQQGTLVTRFGRAMLPAAAIAGASERSIMNQTGHRSVQMVRRYIRDGSLFRENSAGKWGCSGAAVRFCPQNPSLPAHLTG